MKPRKGLSDLNTNETLDAKMQYANPRLFFEKQIKKAMINFLVEIL